jgi:hypothetical protein
MVSCERKSHTAQWRMSSQSQWYETVLPIKRWCYHELIVVCGVCPELWRNVCIVRECEHSESMGTHMSLRARCVKESRKKVWKSDNVIMHPCCYGEFLTPVVSRYRYKCDAVLPWRKVIVDYSPKLAVNMYNEIHERVKENESETNTPGKWNALSSDSDIARHKLNSERIGWVQLCQISFFPNGL